MVNLFGNFDFQSALTNAALLIIPALLSLTVHEVSHGYIAYRLGDRTAKDMGRLTLNPVRHIDPIGLVAMLIFRFGWAKPVPVNMMNFKRPKMYMAVTALAGPVSNLTLAAVVFFIFGLVFRPLGGWGAVGGRGVARDIIRHTAEISIFFAIFNLIPIPPLDGSKVLFSLASDDAYFKLMRYERYGMIALIVFINTQFFQNTIGRAAFTLTQWFFNIFALAGYNLLG